MLNFDSQSWLGGAIKLGYAISLVTTFPLIFFTMRESLAGLVTGDHADASILARLSTPAFAALTLLLLVAQYAKS